MTRRSPEQYDWNKLLFDDRLLTKHFTVQASKNVEAVVFHHMVVKDKDANAPDALDAVYNIWQTREASAQYGVDGKFVGQFVNDKDYAWATGSTHGNRTSINIEMVNSTLDEPGTDRDYMVSETTWKTAAKLAAHVLKAYGLKPVKNVTVRKHSSYFATACPGPYVDRIWDKIFAEVVRVYNGGKTSATPSKPAAKPKPGKPATRPKSHPLVKPWVLPAGHYYGDIAGPNESHGGYYVSERDEVRNIQAWLIYLGLVPGVPSSQWQTSRWADGIWEAPTTAAVRRWFAKYAPGEPYHTRIYADDYAKLVRSR